MLEGIRVLDLTWVLGGPFAGQLLAQLGAEVIKVESPEGDQSRASPPFFFDGDSAIFLSVNRGKKGVAIDLKSDAGRQVFYDLVRASDVVLYGFAPDVPKRLGIDFETLKGINPRICVGELIGVHDEGAYARAPAFDLIVQAQGGIMSITGEEHGAPVRVGNQIGDLAGGLYLALGVCSGLLRALREGKATRMQISLLDCQLALLTWQAQNYFVSGEVPRAMGAKRRIGAPSDAYRCADGRYIAISTGTEDFWRRLCTAVGHGELSADPRFVDLPRRVGNLDALTAELRAIFATRTLAEWLGPLKEARVPCAPVMNVAEALQQPVAGLRGMVQTMANPRTAEPMRFLGSPFKCGDAPTLSYPPRRGESTRAVLREVCGYGEPQIDSLVASQAVYECHPGD
ncbi:CoA transferase [Pigmentiphaga soli]|uniref:CoA transferase n=1 Tax=Pigmentiphaga soli TaxID=1007095 RepID=A0ABP8HN62_9BURK